MKDRYKNNLFFDGDNEYSNSYQIQTFKEEIFEEENISLNLFPIDFNNNLTSKEKKKIIDEWLDVLPSLKTLKSLSIRHSVNIDFFKVVCKIKSLENLQFWSSNTYELNEISNLTNLKRLDLQGFTKITNLSPLVKIKNLSKLSIEKCFNIGDFDTISELNNLIALQLNGDTFAPKKLRLDNIVFIEHLKNLKHLDLLGCNILSKDFSPISELNNLRRLDVDSKVDNDIKKLILENNKNLDSGFFLDWDFENNKFHEEKDW